MTAYVPAVDYDGEELWLNPARQLQFLRPGDMDSPADPEADGWRRLYVREEPAAFEHSDMCEDGDDAPHLNQRGRCQCVCPKCTDGLTCLCPQCSNGDHVQMAARREATS